jgi:hypothetical protein
LRHHSVSRRVLAAPLRGKAGTWFLPQPEQVNDRGASDGPTLSERSVVARKADVVNIRATPTDGTTSPSLRAPDGGWASGNFGGIRPDCSEGEFGRPEALSRRNRFTAVAAAGARLEAVAETAGPEPSRARAETTASGIVDDQTAGDSRHVDAVVDRRERKSREGAFLTRSNGRTSSSGLIGRSVSAFKCHGESCGKAEMCPGCVDRKVSRPEALRAAAGAPGEFAGACGASVGVFATQGVAGAYEAHKGTEAHIARRSVVRRAPGGGGSSSGGFSGSRTLRWISTSRWISTRQPVRRTVSTTRREDGGGVRCRGRRASRRSARRNRRAVGAAGSRPPGRRCARSRGDQLPTGRAARDGPAERRIRRARRHRYCAPDSDPCLAGRPRVMAAAVVVTVPGGFRPRLR